MTKQRRLSRKEKRRLDRDSDHLVNILNQKFAMRQISPLTVSQSDLFKSYKQGKNLAAIGTAGTGKTMCGLYLAMSDVMTKQEYEKIVIIRKSCLVLSAAVCRINCI